MITISKTEKGYLVNDKVILTEQISLKNLDSLSFEEQTALNNFVNAELSGLKISSSCVTV